MVSTRVSIFAGYWPSSLISKESNMDSSIYCSQQDRFCQHQIKFNGLYLNCSAFITNGSIYLIQSCPKAIVRVSAF